MTCHLKMRAGQYTMPSIFKEALADGDKLDSNDLFLHVKMFRPNRIDRLLKQSVDVTLHKLCEEGRLLKSKNYMTDENVSSSQSKFIYFLPDHELDS